MPVGIGPQQQHLVAGPDRHPAGECPEHVVLGLVIEGEPLGVLVGPFAVVFVRGVLLAPDIEPHMPCAVDKDRKHDVAREDHCEPGQRQCLEMLQRRRQIDPDEDGEKGVGNVPGKKIAGKAEEPFHQSLRLRRPGKGRAIADRPVRHPVAACIFTSELRFTHAVLPRRGRHAKFNWRS